MPAPFSEAFRAKIKRDLEEGKDNMTIRKAHNISGRKIKAMRELWEEHGEVWIQSRKHGSGRKPKLQPQHLNELKNFLDANPDAYVKDMTRFLTSRCALKVDETTVWRALQKQGWLQDRMPKPKPRDAQGLWLPTLDKDEDGNPLPEASADDVRNGEGDTPATPKTPTTKKPRAEKKPKLTAADRLVARARDYARDHMSSARFDGSHDWGHVERMTKMAMHLLECEKAAHPNIIYDSLLLEVAALMHDIEDHKYKPPPPPSNLTPPTLAQQNGNHLPPYAYPPQPQSQISTPQTPHDADSSTQLDPAMQLATAAAAPPPSFPWPANMPPPTPIPPPHHPGAPMRQVPDGDPILKAQQTALHTHLKAIRTPNHLIHILTSLIPCISHSFSQSHPALAASTAVSHPELHILQDADRLDALGGVGIARAFMYAGAHVHGPLLPPPPPPPLTGPEHRNNVAVAERLEKERMDREKGKWLEGGGVMGETLRHFEEKIVRLEGLMWTEEGKRIARERTDRLHLVKGWLHEEMGVGDYLPLPMPRERDGGGGYVEGRGEGGMVLDGITNYAPRMQGAEGMNGFPREGERRYNDPGTQLMGEMYGTR